MLDFEWRLIFRSLIIAPLMIFHFFHLAQLLFPNVKLLQYREPLNEIVQLDIKARPFSQHRNAFNLPFALWSE
jgi:hypothetical protein